MSSRNGYYKGLNLPQSLQNELGLDIQDSKGGRGARRNGNFAGRKERRKAERDQKKSTRAGNGRPNNQPLAQRSLDQGRQAYTSSEIEDEKPDVIAPVKTSKATPAATKTPTDPQIKSILKKPTPRPPSPPQSDESDSVRSTSPGLVLDRTSKAFRDRAAQDDTEIRALEKKLGIKSKKRSKTFDEDGLGDLLEGLDSDAEVKKRKREVDEWLRRKRRKAELDAGSGNAHHDDLDDLEESQGSDTRDLEEGSGDDSVDTDDVGSSNSSVNEDFDGFDESESDVTPPTIKLRENPYVAPVTLTSPATKYIPPSLRKTTSTDTEALQRLRRQIQGHLNKLSEANIVSILTEVEKLYQSNARQDVTSTLTDLLLSLFCDRSALQPTFVILHAAFIAAVYKVIGTDFGAQVVSKVVERWDEYYKDATTYTGKESLNLTSLLSHLYTFNVISCNLIFDYIRHLLEELSETNTELVLKIVRDSGPQLRQDDPSALKDIVRIMQNASAKAAADGVQISVRTKFMIESITDLKNNKIKASASINGVAIEHITRMRKVLGSLNTRTLRATEPLRIGRQDIRESDKRGKWWLVGASWKGNEASADTNSEMLLDVPAVSNIGDDIETDEADLSNLARNYGMNTSVRRSIFVAIMSASDYQDAHVRLLKLRLKRSQEQEIPRVLLRCAGAEGVYNPYYTLIAKKLCTEKKTKMAFQFSLWNFLKRMGEKGQLDDSDDEEEEDGSEPVELKEIVNLAKMYGHLIADGHLSLGILKILNLAYLKEQQAKTFVELLLIRVILSATQDGSTARGDASEKSLSNAFLRVADTPQIHKGLLYFIKKVVANSDLAGSKQERATVKWGCKVAVDTLRVLSTSNIAAD